MYTKNSSNNNNNNNNNSNNNPYTNNKFPYNRKCFNQLYTEVIMACMRGTALVLQPNTNLGLSVHLFCQMFDIWSESLDGESVHPIPSIYIAQHNIEGRGLIFMQ
jgi:hypothetical protein